MTQHIIWYYDQLFVYPMVLEHDTSEEALTRLGCLLYGAGFVKDSYTQAIVEREKIYPTALPTQIGVAVPHTDSLHVLTLSMAVGILSRPVIFKEMGSSGDKEVPVQVVMSLAVPNPKQVVAMLRHLFDVIQIPDFLPTLVKMTEREKISRFLEEKINTCREGELEENGQATADAQEGRQVLLKINHPVGLHARPASLFVKTARNYNADILVNYNGKEVNAKSILNVLQLGAGKGAEIIISAKGIDRDEALQALTELVETDFGGVA